ncbi:monocarboxylate transporter 12-like [Argopecten irradians]|uniref:monocarboxylate transporter 12-like n=1 Tax=Argopecten irradians TaxID=31199 RepID=UPI0037125A7B
MEKAPDGGWGWVVTIASFLINLLVEGVDYTFGIFFPVFLETFGESKGKTQLLHSVLIGTLLIIGPFVSALVNRYGSRVVGGSGAVIASLGFFLSAFSPNINVMIVFYSIIGGIGFGLLYLPCIVMLGVYFEKRRVLATGIAVCGAGIGAFVFAPVFSFLLDTYLWRGTMWILSGITLNGIVFSATFRPLKGRSNRSITKVISNDKCDTVETSKNTYGSCKLFCMSTESMFDFSLLKSPTMILYAASCLLVMFGFYVPSNFLPVLAADVHLTTEEGAFLILLMGVSNTVTRVVIGYIADKPWANCLIINNSALLIGGLTTCFAPFYTNLTSLAAYALLFGAVMAIFFLLRSILIAELLGVHRLNSAFGLVGLSMGISTFVGSPIAGILSDISGHYNLAFYFGGITLGLGGLICLPLRYIATWENRRTANTNLSITLNVDEVKKSENVKTLSFKWTPSVYVVSHGYI